MVTFKKFKVGDLFDVNQGRRLKKSDFKDGNIPFVMASSKNNGIVAYLSNPVTTNENFITADILGNVFYQDGFVGFGDDNCGLKLKHGHESEAVYLYLVGILSRFKSIASYGNKLRGKWYKEQFIHLPVKPGTDEVNYVETDIDWEYMASRIRELEASRIRELEAYRIRELEAYLQESGLENYELTVSERSLLEVKPTFGEFKVGDLFETSSYRGGLQVLTGGNVPSKLLEPGDTPRISVTSKNNGIIGYYNDVDMKSYRVFENAISVSFLGTVFYHPYRASYDMKVHCLRLKDHELRENESLYLVSVLKKMVSVYSYSNQLSSTEIVDITLTLPIQVNVQGKAVLDGDGNVIPDWDYMEAMIRIMEKQVIRDVVDYKDAVIATTKKVIA